MNWILIAAPALPILLALLIPFGGRIRRLAIVIGPLAAVPSLGLALLPDATEPAIVPWLLLESWLGIDQTGQIFLLLTSLLWTAAGLYARAYHAPDDNRHRFWFFFLLSMAGNLGLVLAFDAVTFYTAFALMTFSAYGLVVHSGGERAARAGKVYLVMAVIGEGFLLSGLILAAHAGGGIAIESLETGIVISDNRNLIVGFLIAGFGIKAGSIPLHIWLPLAHPVAPTPASAVLSGAMIKAGMLGWIRFLPLGETEFAGWGMILVVISLTAAFFGVLFGLTQDDPKTLLAYSSISQMGFISTVVAIGLARPESWPVAVTGCALYVLHHGLIKGALFLGVGVAHETGDNPARQRLVMAGLTLAGLALAGAPLMTGALAKASLKEGVYLGPAGWAGWLEWLLPLAAVGTTVLMGRFLWIVWWYELGHRDETPRSYSGLAVPWIVLLVLAFPAVWLAPAWFGLPFGAGVAFEPANLWASTWPVVVGALLLGGLWFAVTRTRAQERFRPVRIPAGDLLIPLERVLERMRPEADPDEMIPRPRDPVAQLGASWYGLFAESDPSDRTSRFSRWLIDWQVAGILFVALMIVIAVLMIQP